MIICIEYWKGDVFLYGKNTPLPTLKSQICTVESLYDSQEDNFVPLLCRMYGWTLLETAERTLPDCTYDRDTGLLF